jgi:hypothetical protein
MVRRWRLIGYFPILYNPTHLMHRSRRPRAARVHDARQRPGAVARPGVARLRTTRNRRAGAPRPKPLCFRPASRRCSRESPLPRTCPVSTPSARQKTLCFQPVSSRGSREKRCPKHAWIQRPPSVILLPKVPHSDALFSLRTTRSRRAGAPLTRRTWHTTTQKGANRNVRGFGWEISLTRLFRDAHRFPSTRWFPRAGGYTYDVGVWDVSIIQGPFSVAPCHPLQVVQLVALRFATFPSLNVTQIQAACVLTLLQSYCVVHGCSHVFSAHVDILSEISPIKNRRFLPGSCCIAPTRAIQC